jgi:3alpha(or 20beta)-hydroxysteroid dehydrogenase
MAELNDRPVAIVTGAGGGIGAATVRRLVADGWRVAAVDLATEGTEALVADLGDDVFAVQGDVSTAEGAQAYVSATLDHFGRLDALHNNAGIEGKASPIEDQDPGLFLKVLQINAGGVFYGMRAVLPHFYRQGHGAIVNTASQAGLEGVPGLSPYGASKHAVVGLTRTAAAEGGPHGVRVNAIAPGQIATRMMDSLEDQWDSESAAQAHDALVATIPMGRYGRPEEMANAVAWLLSEDASFINGAILTADGGSTV